MFGESGEPGGGIGKERFGCPGDIRDLRLMVEQLETNMTWAWRRYNWQIAGGLVICFFSSRPWGSQEMVRLQWLRSQRGINISCSGIGPR